MPEEQLQEGSIAHGILVGCLFQILFVLVGFLLIYFVRGKASILMLSSWGLTQWIAIGPMIWRERANGSSKTANGLIIIGCIGLLLSSGCAAFFSR